MSTGMLIAVVLTSECIDSSGESVDLAGCDFSDIDTDGGIVVNWEHAPGEQGPGTIVGKVVYVKKIFSEKDCDNDIQRKQWEQIKLPFATGVVRLFDGAGHANAQAIAAIIRDNVANGEPVACRWSVEGQTLAREGNRLTECVVKKLACTLKPANRTASSTLLLDPNAPDGFEKDHDKKASKDVLESVDKSEFQDPMFQRLGGSVEVAYNPIVDAPALSKMLSAGGGYGSTAPNALSGGAALQMENLRGAKKKTVEVIHKFVMAENFSKDELKAALKHEMPEASDAYLDHFADIAGDYHMRRSQLKPKKESSFEKSLRLDALGIQLRKATQEMEITGQNDPRIPVIYAVRVKMPDGEHRAGRYMLVNNEIHHLEDYFGLMEFWIPEGPITQQTLLDIYALRNNPRVTVTREDAPAAESTTATQVAPLAEPQLVAQAQMRPPSVFDYQRAGMDQPHTLEVSNGIYLLDGNRLSFQEVQTLLDNVKKGVATVRYKSIGSSQMQAIQKMEKAFEVLSKEEHDPEAALNHVRQLLGHDHPTTRALTSHIFEDPMTGMGNKYAADKFKAKNKPGAYIQLDGNDMKAINDEYGHTTGDQAIKAWGGAVTSALQQVAPGVGKSFRNGGDEYMVHVPSHEHAAQFARALHQHLEALPPVNGVHKLSMGMGIGHTLEHADQALLLSKNPKYLPGQDHLPARQRVGAFPKGQVPNLAHDLTPGHEGPVPLHNPGVHALNHVSAMPEPKPAAPSTPHAPLSAQPLSA